MPLMRLKRWRSNRMRQLSLMHAPAYKFQTGQPWQEKRKRNFFKARICSPLFSAGNIVPPQLQSGDSAPALHGLIFAPQCGV